MIAMTCFDLPILRSILAAALLASPPICASISSQTNKHSGDSFESSVYDNAAFSMASASLAISPEEKVRSTGICCDFFFGVRNGRGLSANTPEGECLKCVREERPGLTASLPHPSHHSDTGIAFSEQKQTNLLQKTPSVQPSCLACPEAGASG